MIHWQVRTIMFALLAMAAWMVAGGCQSPRSYSALKPPSVDASPVDPPSLGERARLGAGDRSAEPPRRESPAAGQVVPVSLLQPAEGAASGADLSALVAEALSINPQLRRLQSEANEAWARVPQVRALPDPMLQGTVFGEPMRMADGENRGTLMVSQTIPFLKRLDARGQQATFEALMREQQVRAAELRITADVQEAWSRLYLLGQLLRINEANERLVQSLLEAATARVEVGLATAGDVILAAVELSRIEEERLLLDQQVAARRAVLNQLLNRPADGPLPLPAQIDEVDLETSPEALRQLARTHQPEIAMAELQTQATAWGVRVANLERVPDLTLSYEHMFMRMNPGEHGSDPWQVGVGINIPLWHGKYTAMQQEASQRHFAAHAGVEETVRANDAMLLDLWEQFRTADRTARLYRETILPQVRQALEADQRAYGQGAVQFERVINNARNLITAEAAYHRALTDKAIAVARLEQALGTRVPAAPRPADLPMSLAPMPIALLPQGG